MKQKVRRGPVVFSSPSGSGGNMSLDLRMAAGTLWGVQEAVVGRWWLVHAVNGVKPLPST